jgi:hypothetical protein
MEAVLRRVFAAIGLAIAIMGGTAAPANADPIPYREVCGSLQYSGYHFQYRACTAVQGSTVYHILKVKNAYGNSLTATIWVQKSYSASIATCINGSYVVSSNVWQEFVCYSKTYSGHWYLTAGTVNWSTDSVSPVLFP